MNFIIPLAAATPGVYYAFQHSDSVGKGIVVLLLVISSITWTVMVDKGMELRRARRSSQRFLAKFRGHQGSISSASLSREHFEGPLGDTSIP